MKIKTNDQVKIIAGKDNGKAGKVLQVFKQQDRLSIEGLNLLVKHMRPRRSGEKGQRIEFPAPLNVSNVMLVCPKCGKPTRVSFELPKDETGKTHKVRACKRCKNLID
ncbi:50S ribosomal protein L24 [Candidatus Falkowbacteria bacterium CG10_big_fil_rev_8_21_14_0_10_37_14]|uniref:Large ribosomal subunit protein uL24 n=1 Tax=Candidatus Falkowbacteria bacterium CG10_big_fil_rev_8_21_14_0_10_37_14 TaxID=1974561 RepID=A0A2M6WTY1_9BACT|nr:50S ribosomal protein L24 [Candidatus Falkowbacteria bacterium]PIT96237.1 MAG: 50S ribosomal protein L24 [Candidatus Falkowbacteria bacterium CG10_big_fil_rev_8_21_14_0_10_37_14]